MANVIKAQQEILDKLNISKLNSMQEEAIPVIETTTNTVLLSPTGTGKTLAFLLPSAMIDEFFGKPLMPNMRIMDPLNSLFSVL